MCLLLLYRVYGPYLLKVNHCLVLAAQGETSVVRAWHLRPSLIWKDGEWIEWSNLRENVSASQEVRSYA